MKYETSLDKPARGITIAVTVLFLAVIVSQYILFAGKGRFIPVYITVTLVFIYLLAFLFRPAGYIVNSEQLIIHRLIRNVKIERSDIAGAQLIDKEKIAGAIRIFGVGGLFGFFGIFSNRSIGRMTWYATRRDRVVLLVTRNNKKIILTPDNPNAFVLALGIPGGTGFIE